MFSKPERDATTPKRRIAPELIQPYPSVVDDVDALVVVPTPPSICESVRVPPVAEDQSECIICYESLSPTKNMCITECGHKFCFKCMMKHAQRNNGCPICRTAMIEETSDSEEDDDYEEDDDETVEEETDESYPEFEIEKFVEAFETKGYGLKDALSLLLHKFSKTDEKFTKEYINNLDKDVEDICEELQNECEEREEMAAEDERR